MIPIPVIYAEEKNATQYENEKQEYIGYFLIG